MKQSLDTWEDRYKSAAYWWVVSFGAGLIKPAPGTWGSFAGLLMGYGLLLGGITLLGLITLCVIVTLLSIKAIDTIEQKTGVHDAPEIVIDEVVGQWLAMLPLLYFTPDLTRLTIAFALFRIFDIIKPWPIKWLDQYVTGGFGVMIDDVVAGLIAAGLLLAGLMLGYI